MHRARLGIIVVAIALAAVWLYLVVPRASKIPEPAVRRPAVAAPLQPVAPPAPPAPTQTNDPTPTAAAVEPPPPVAPDDSAGDDATQQDAPADVAPSGPPPVDADHAADLFADQLARQDGDVPPGSAEDPARALWNRFDHEKTDADWSDRAAAHLRETLGAWLAEIPEQSGAHLALVRVECRSSLCQVLAADNDETGQNENASDGAEWQQAIARLHDAPWWNEVGFGEVTTQVTTADDYVLYTTYLARATVPPEQAPADPTGG